MHMMNIGHSVSACIKSLKAHYIHLGKTDIFLLIYFTFCSRSYICTNNNTGKSETKQKKLSIELCLASY